MPLSDLITAVRSDISGPSTMRDALYQPTPERIATAIRASGSHWADPTTMRTFGSRVLSGTPGLRDGVAVVWFTSSERDRAMSNGRRRYTVRVFDGDSVTTIGHFGEHLPARAAGKAPRAPAAAHLVTT